MTKYRKGPQRTTKEHYTGPQRIGYTAKGPQRTAKEHYGLSGRKLVLIELNGAFRISLIHFSVYSVYRLEGAVRAAAAARPARCVLVGMRRRCCMARSNQHLLMAA